MAASSGAPSGAPKESHEPASWSTLQINTSGDAIDVIRRLSATSGPRASSSLSSAPNTPAPRDSPARRPSYQAHPPVATAPSPKPNTLRRTSSSTSLNKQAASPALVRRGSRSSLGGADEERKLTPKRSISNLISGLREAQTTMAAIEEPIPLTAPQIASQHFSRELHRDMDPSLVSPTVVILHDACYGHRFSRLKTSKTSLSLIVERPERIHASILGASTAYVRLGGHYAGGRNAPYPDRTPTSRPPFQIRRSNRAVDIKSAFVTNVHGSSWMSELKQMCHSAGEKLANSTLEIARQQDTGEAPKPQFHEGDLYLAPDSLAAFEGALGGVADAIDTVFAAQTQTKRAFVAVRPPGHHCSADYPSGFCWLNNVHVGIEYAAQTHGLTHAAIFDFDLHHGDGSQAIAWQRNSQNNIKRVNARPNSKLKLGPDIGYYSLHDINSYPCENGDDGKVQAASLCIDNAHGQSIWNVHLQPWKSESDFWSLYENQYKILFSKARTFLQHHTKRLHAEGKTQPKAAIFISAGFDASEWEGAGMQRHKVNVPTEFYARFTQDVLKLARETGTACEGRTISVLEGGYSDRALCSGVLSHLSGLCAPPLSPSDNANDGLAGLNLQMNGLTLNGNEGADGFTYDTSWWSAANLTALEMKVNPPPPPQAKKSRLGPQPTYATPTESFAYKVVNPNKFARSISGTMRESAVPTRPPTPPPPEVEWVVATQELSNLLIPQDRQTKSCTPDELTVSRPKKEPHGDPLPKPSDTFQPRQLRDRRSKTPAPPGSSHSEEPDSLRSVSRSSRRETIDVLPISSNTASGQRGTSRRLSAGSALSGTHPDTEHKVPPIPPVPSVMASDSTTNVATRERKSVGCEPTSKKARAPSRFGNNVGTNGTTTNSATAAKTSSNPSSSPSRASSVPSQASDVDRLSSGFKKVTLKVSATKEEHDRKQKEKLDAERRARALKGAETRKINAAAKKAAKDISAPKVESRSNPHHSGIPVSIPVSSAAPTAIPSVTDSHSGVLSASDVQTGAAKFEHHSNSRPSSLHSTSNSAAIPGSQAEACNIDHAASDAALLQAPVQALSTGSIQTDEFQHQQKGPYEDLPPAEGASISNGVGNDSLLSREVAPHNQPTMDAGSSSQLNGHNAASNVYRSNLPSLHNPLHRGKLPIWSSTGPIPFSKAATGSNPGSSVPGESTEGAGLP